MPCRGDSCPKTHPILTVSRIKPREILYWRHFFHTSCFLHYSKVRFPMYCGKRVLQGRKKSWDMSTYCVPKCGRHFVKFEDVTIYPVLVVAGTVLIMVISVKWMIMLHSHIDDFKLWLLNLILSKISTILGAVHRSFFAWPSFNSEIFIPQKFNSGC